MIKKLLLSLFAVSTMLPVNAQGNKKTASTPSPVKEAASIGSFTSGMSKNPGYFTFYWDDKKGKIWLEIDKFDTEFLYYASLAAGVGSNDIGLDRGRIGPGHVVKFQRTGPKVLLVEPNYDYRAISNDAAERETVEQSFAQSVHWGFDIVAEEGDKVLVDASPFLLQDAINAGSAISRTKQGNYKLDPSRSAVYLPRTKSFPQNTEFEVTITLTGDAPGNYLQQVVPSPNAVTMRQHHSFVQLPDSNYEPREFDPRSGVGYIQYMDFATPVSEPIMKRFIRRHRLQKKDPKAAVSEPVKPIIYYMDPGAPEPIRTALMEGASWWNQAFEAAGYKNAFQVKLLPADADPMDIRYNYIQWVHRSTRGWSYGGGVTDPRTGEIIKGKVTLGSLRIRQDFLIAQGLVAAYEEGKEVSKEMMEMSLARIRQLAAHEVGHTLGLPHNYASNHNNRASVMDYPHPVVNIKNGQLDLSDAYAKGIGEWDKIAINYAYQDFPEGTNEKQALQAIIKESLSKDMLFLTDQDGRPEGSAHPITHLWDNGKNAVEELKHVMEVRSIALKNFSEKKIPVGAPMATLEEILVPMYMFHRYQVEAAAKSLGGVFYTYAARGDGQRTCDPLPPKEQMAALNGLMATLKPEALALPESIIKMIPPRPYGYDENPRETFKDRTGLTFDPMGPPEAAANMTLNFMLQHERAARLTGNQALNNAMPGFNTVVDRLMEETWKAAPLKGYNGEIKRLVEKLTLQHLTKLAGNKEAASQVRAMATLKVNELKSWLESRVSGEKDASQKAHFLFALSQIREFENNPAELNQTIPLTVPDGAPIGMPSFNYFEMGCDDNF
jgi:hypothetical protein